MKEKVKEDYYQEKAQQKLAHVLKDYTEQAKKGSWAGLKPETTEWLKKDDSQKLALLEKKGIALSSLLPLDIIGSATSVTTKEGGFVIKLDEIAPFDATLFTQKKNEIRKELLQRRTNLMMVGFIASLWRSATITKNESVLQAQM